MLKPVFSQGRKAIVLMSDDSPDFVELARDSLATARLRVDLHHVSSGDQCMDFLRGAHPFERSPRPDLLVLDLAMPRVDGFEVMEQIRADPALRTLPVVVMTTSASEQDVDRMYALGCNSYVVRPADLSGFARGMRQLARYWFGLVVLPQR